MIENKGFIEAMLAPVCEIDSKVTIDGVTYANDRVVSVNPHYEGEIAKTLMKCVEIELNGFENADEAMALKGKVVTSCQLGAKLESEEDFNYIALGVFSVYEVEYDEDSEKVHLICYDNMVKLAEPYTMPYALVPATTNSHILRVIEAICDHLNITIDPAIVVKQNNPIVGLVGQGINGQMYTKHLGKFQAVASPTAADLGNYYELVTAGKYPYDLDPYVKTTDTEIDSTKTYYEFIVNTSYTYRDFLDMVAQETGANFYFDLQGRLSARYPEEAKWHIKTTDTEIDTTKTYYVYDEGEYVEVAIPSVEDIGEYYEYKVVTLPVDKMRSLHFKKQYGVVNSMLFLYANPTTVTQKEVNNDASIVEHGKTQYVIKEQIELALRRSTITLGQTLNRWLAIENSEGDNGLWYTLFDYTSYGFGFLEFGDIFNIEDKSGNTKRTIMLSNNLVFSVDSVVESAEAKAVEAPTPDPVDALANDFNDYKNTTDETIGTLNEDVSQAEDDIANINTAIDGLNDAIDGLNDTVGELTEDTGWQPIEYSSDFEDYSSGQALKFRVIGNLVEIRGACKPTATITGSGTQYTIGSLEYDGNTYAPTATIQALQQGSFASIWLLEISTTGELKFSRYRNGDTYVDCTPSYWLPIHAMFYIGG